MHAITRALLFFSFIHVFHLALKAQDPVPVDSTIIFEPSNPDLISASSYKPLRNAWGIDLMLSNNGFGIGAFLRREFNDNLSGFINFAISDVKDEDEVELYDPYTGQPFVLGKKNRLLMFPLTLGIQYRLFKDDIVDNFRPFLSAGIGPSMVMFSPYSRVTITTFPDGTTYPNIEQVEFFSSLKYAQAQFTLGGYVGGGAYFGLDRGTLSGISFRYYYISFKKGIEILNNVHVKRFGGFFITLNFGSLY